MSSGKTPLVIELAIPSTSVAIVAAQFFSAVVAGEVRELGFLLVGAGCRDWEQFCHIYPDKARRVRAVARHSSYWIRRRLIDPYMSKGACDLYKLGAPELPVPEREQAQLDFMGKSPCCIGMFPSQVQRAARERGALLQLAWRHVLYWHAWLSSWLSSIADLERRNRRSKVLATTAQQKFEHLQAEHIVEEAKLINNVMARRTMAPLTNGEYGRAPGPTPPKRNRAPIELFRDEAWIAA